MEIFKFIPIDIVNNILSYDNRFVIRNGNVVNKLNTIKYKNVIHLLENKPKINNNKMIKIPYVYLSKCILAYRSISHEYFYLQLRL